MHRHYQPAVGAKCWPRATRRRRGGGAAAAMDDDQRQCRLVDQTAGAIQEISCGEIAATAPRLLARADDVLGASRRLGARGVRGADAFVARSLGAGAASVIGGGRPGAARRRQARQDAPPPPPQSPPSSPFGGDVERRPSRPSATKYIDPRRVPRARRLIAAAWHARGGRRAPRTPPRPAEPAIAHGAPARRGGPRARRRQGAAAALAAHGRPLRGPPGDAPWPRPRPRRGGAACCRGGGRGGGGGLDHRGRH